MRLRADKPLSFVRRILRGVDGVTVRLQSQSVRLRPSLIAAACGSLDWNREVNQSPADAETGPRVLRRSAPTPARRPTPPSQILTSQGSKARTLRKSAGSPRHQVTHQLQIAPRSVDCSRNQLRAVSRLSSWVTRWKNNQALFLSFLPQN